MTASQTSRADRGTPDRVCEVLIAGLGPVGAALAALLGKLGVSVIVIEPEKNVYPLPRAAHLDHEIMRIFQAIDIVDAIQPYVREAPDYEFRTALGDLLIKIEREGVRGASGWCVSYNFYQPGIEEALRDVLSEMPDVEIIYSAKFLALNDNGEDSINATIEIDGNESGCTASFLVGCDGAWSPVRESCGIRFDDYGFDEPWLVIDAVVDDDRYFPAVNLQVCDPARPTTFVHMGPGRLRWEFMLKPGEDPEDMKRDAMIEELLGPWHKFGAIAVERRAVYRFHGLVADRWQSNRVFIAGDAAHQMPPFMGQGLCSGLRDAANLAWKLSAVLRDGANPALLDSYQIERDPHVRYVVERAIQMGKVVCTLDGDIAARRNAEMSIAPSIGPPNPFPPFAAGCLLVGSPGAGSIFPQAVDLAANLFLDEIIGAGAWLLSRHDADVGARTRGITAVNVHSLPGSLARATLNWLEAHHVEAVLVRPDRYVFGSGPAPVLVDAYKAWVGPKTILAGTSP